MLKILISNDDGIHALGLKTLAERLSMQYEVYVVAPDRERSATGHALTLHKPLRVDEVNLGDKVKQAYAVTGTPSDCVKIALNALLDFKPDVVLSGINHGPNLGTDVLYSGTVSAALEGAINDIPSIATSLINGYDKNAEFSHGAEFIANFIPYALTLSVPPKNILNVNLPAVPYCDYAGVKLTHLGIRMYTDNFEKRVDPRNQVYYWLAGEVITESDDGPDSDMTAIRNNLVSVSPVSMDMTNWQYVESHQSQVDKLNSVLFTP